MLAINGVGAGIGATIAGLADLTFIAEDARLRCPFSALGLTAEAASTYTFPRLLGHQRATWFLLSSEWISANECVEAGLALQAWPKDELMERVMEQAQKLAALPAASLIQTKALMMDPIRDELKAAAVRENDGYRMTMYGTSSSTPMARLGSQPRADSHESFSRR